MAGNSVSVMAISTQGRGGRQSETLPRTKGMQFTLHSNNARYRCNNCGTVLTNIYKVDENTKCPYCNSKDIITMSGREPVTYNTIDKVIELISDKETMSLREFADYLNLSVSSAKYWLPKLPKNLYNKIQVPPTNKSRKIQEEREYKIVECYNDGKKYAEIAKILDIKTSLVLSYIKRARNKGLLPSIEEEIFQRRQKVYNLLLQGKSNREISQDVKVSLSTVCVDIAYINSHKNHFNCTDTFVGEDIMYTNNSIDNDNNSGNVTTNNIGVVETSPKEIIIEPVEDNDSKNIISNKKKKDIPLLYEYPRESTIANTASSIIELRKSGKTWKEISKQLSLTEGTVRTYYYTHKGTQRMSMFNDALRRGIIRKLLVMGKKVKEICQILQIEKSIVSKDRYDILNNPTCEIIEPTNNQLSWFLRAE